MKKFLSLALSLILLCSLCACGGGKDPGGGGAGADAPELQTQAPAGDSREPEGDSYEEGTVEAYLAGYGMTVEDLTVEGVTEVALLDNGDISIATGGNPSPELIRAWHEKVYDKCRALSDDGKVYTPETFNLEGDVTGATEFILSDQVNWEEDFSGGWGSANTENFVYPSGGERVWVFLRWESASAGEFLTFLITR